MWRKAKTAEQQILPRKEAANGLDPESGSYWCPDSNNHNAESERWKSLITVGYKVDH